MNKKEIISFGEKVIIELDNLGICGSIKESITTNSIYVHTPFFNVRISSHHSKKGIEAYNFVNRNGGNLVRIIGGKLHFPINDNGLNLFIEEIKNRNIKKLEVKEDKHKKRRKKRCRGEFYIQYGEYPLYLYKNKRKEPHLGVIKEIEKCNIDGISNDDIIELSKVLTTSRKCFKHSGYNNCLRHVPQKYKNNFKKIKYKNESEKI